jgi:hypothetical protein
MWFAYPRLHEAAPVRLGRQRNEKRTILHSKERLRRHAKRGLATFDPMNALDQVRGRKPDRASDGERISLHEIHLWRNYPCTNLCPGKCPTYDALHSEIRFRRGHRNCCRPRRLGAEHQSATKEAMKIAETTNGLGLGTAAAFQSRGFMAPGESHAFPAQVCGS